MAASGCCQIVMTKKPRTSDLVLTPPVVGVLVHVNGRSHWATVPLVETVVRPGGPGVVTEMSANSSQRTGVSSRNSGRLGVGIVITRYSAVTRQSAVIRHGAVISHSAITKMSSYNRLSNNFNFLIWVRPRGSTTYDLACKLECDRDVTSFTESSPR